MLRFDCTAYYASVYIVIFLAFWWLVCTPLYVYCHCALYLWRHWMIIDLILILNCNWLVCVTVMMVLVLCILQMQCHSQRHEYRAACGRNVWYSCAQFMTLTVLLLKRTMYRKNIEIKTILCNYYACWVVWRRYCSSVTCTPSFHYMYMIMYKYEYSNLFCEFSNSLTENEVLPLGT